MFRISARTRKKNGNKRRGKWRRRQRTMPVQPKTRHKSKEGIMHICMTYINPGDLVLIPNPGYPTYQSAAKLAGAILAAYQLKEENGWLPDFSELKDLVKSKPDKQESVLMFVNYPQMPTGQLPSKKLFEDLVTFAKENRVLLVHDNPYSFILNDEPKSILQI